MQFVRPTESELRQALARAGSMLASEPIEFLAEGWEFWAFSAGDYVLRCPRPPVNLHRLPAGTTNLDSLALERRLLPELSAWLTAPVPDIDVYTDDGPNGLPLAGHRKVPGEPVMFASRRPGPGFGAALGLLIRELQSFPVERAMELGVPMVEGQALREQRARHYERVIRGVFPLVSCEARSRIEQVFDAYLSKDSNFEFEPKLVHQDLDMNVLIDSHSGELSGVIDFGGAIVSNPALDLWLPLIGRDRLGVDSQLGAFRAASGLSTDEVEFMRGEVEFVDFNFPLTDILSGLERADEAQVAEGILQLNARVPFGMKC